jgi:hypothetical protein
MSVIDSDITHILVVETEVPTVVIKNEYNCVRQNSQQEM